MGPLELTLRINRDRFSAHGWTDLEIDLELRNVSQGALAIYPEVAQFMPAAGWYSPAWEIALESPRAVLGFRELRTYYGPPGMPPNGSVFETARITLEPDSIWQSRIAMCFLSRDELGAAELTRDAVDPQGMDGVSDDELDAEAMLVLHATRAALEQRPPGQRLRPGRVAFVPTAGTIDVIVRYHQEPWSGFFAPPASLTTESNRLTLHLA